MKVKTAVIDTNVLISAALSPKGTPAQVVSFLVEHGRIVFSDETFEAFHSRLWRPKFDAYISREMRQSLLRDFSNIAKWTTPEKPLKLCRDADDDKFLSLAVSAKVSVLVSGDTDLTVLKNIEGIPIYTPTQCLEIIKNGE
ncbi:MAG: putative toxin-antitoxin system toxin component, PIN family [Arenicellales bacterium]